jgi:beta-N-acetylhexosaminidase
VKPLKLALGPVMLDVASLRLNEDDRRRLSHAHAGGVILFARNFQSPSQLRELCAEIKALREPELLIAVDHEGGRVQRFRTGFTLLPPMAELGRVWRDDPSRAIVLAHSVGKTLAAELLRHGVDFSFTPVVDLDFGRSQVIGDRAFHADASVVGELAAALQSGLRAAGMVAVAKHYPGHGFAEADSHIAIPVDSRSLAEIEAADLQPYATLIDGGLAAVMPAHVIYPAVDHRPAGFSPVWLREILRGRMRFKGVVFSDDLSMEGASVAGEIVARGLAALSAGCDMVLVCNRPVDADRLLAGLPSSAVADQARLLALRGAPATMAPGELEGAFAQVSRFMAQLSAA